MEVIKSILKCYKELLDIAPRVRELDEKTYLAIEDAAARLAAALTYLRMRGKLDPKTAEELESLLTGIA